MKKRIFAWITILLVTMTMILSACGNETAEADAKRKYAVFIAENTNPFTMSVGEAAKQYGDALGYTINIFDGKYDLNTQIGQLETAIAQGYDGLILEPVAGDGYTSVLKQAGEMGIPVVTIIQELEDQSQVDAIIPTKNVLVTIDNVDTFENE